MAGVLIGAALISLGAVVIACCRSERAERRANPTVLDQSRVELAADPVLRLIAYNEHFAVTPDDLRDVEPALQAFLTLPVVPGQREPGRWS